MKLLIAILKIIFFTVVGFVCTVMVGYAFVDMIVNLQQVIIIHRKE